jgi:signal transduction histidine kinase
VGPAWRDSTAAAVEWVWQLRYALKTAMAKWRWTRPLAHDRAASASEPDILGTLLAPTLAAVRWGTVAALLLLSIAQPLIGRTGLPTWVLILIFAAYNGLITLSRRSVPWLGSFRRIAVVDLLVVGALYTIAASPGGPIFILFLLITVCAAATNQWPRTLVYTAVVLLLMVIISPALPLWTAGSVGKRDLFARLIVIALTSSMTAVLVRRLEHEHRSACSSREQAAQQAELNRLRGVFVSSVSHDLRTPLTAMRAGLGMLQMSAHDRLRADEEQLLTAARRNSERLGLLIDDLLTYQQLEVGTLRIVHTAVDLREVASNAVATLRPLLDEKGQSITLDLGEALSATGDSRQLEQALVNVLANAHQHTPTGTQILIAGHVAPHELHVTVSDDGPGIPAEELERVFVRFHRLAPAGGGSGLGLAIARSIVEHHGGRLWAESEGGRGTSVHLALPRGDA